MAVIFLVPVKKLVELIWLFFHECEIIQLLSFSALKKRESAGLNCKYHINGISH